MSKNNASVYERELKEIFESENFLVVRAAGSHGVDLVILHGTSCYPIEIKSSAQNTIRFSSASNYANKQAKALIEECKRAELLPIYAFRLINTNRGGVTQLKWRFFTLPALSYTMPVCYVHYREAIPKIRLSGNGGYIMKWNDGMTLPEFLRLIK